MVVAAIVLGLFVSETVSMILAKADGGRVVKQALVTFFLFIVLPVWFYVVMKMTEAGIEGATNLTRTCSAVHCSCRALGEPSPLQATRPA